MLLYECIVFYYNYKYTKLIYLSLFCDYSRDLTTISSIPVVFFIYFIIYNFM